MSIEVSMDDPELTPVAIQKMYEEWGELKVEVYSTFCHYCGNARGLLKHRKTGEISCERCVLGEAN